MRIYGMQFNASQRIYDGATAGKCSLYQVFAYSTGFQSKNIAYSKAMYRSKTGTKAISICGSNGYGYFNRRDVGYISRK
jgi:hypothetical protein